MCSLGLSSPDNFHHQITLITTTHTTQWVVLIFFISFASVTSEKLANHHSVTRISVHLSTGLWLPFWVLCAGFFVSQVILLGKVATLQGATRCTTSGNTGRLCHRWALPPHQIIFSQEDQKQKVVFFGLDIWTIPQWRIEAKRRTGHLLLYTW